MNQNKKFWEELIAYFPLIRQGQHRNRRIQQFFRCRAAKSLASCYLATIGGYIDRTTRSPFIKHGTHKITSPTILLLLRVFVDAGT
jgi:hypothetical protein